MTQHGKKLAVICNDFGYFMHHRFPVIQEIASRFTGIGVYCGGELPAAGETPGVSFTVIDCERFRFSLVKDIKLFFQLLAMLFRERPDVIHTITIKPNLVGGLAVGAYRIFSLRNPTLVMMSPGLGRIFAREATSTLSGLRRRVVSAGLRIALWPRRSFVAFENFGDRRAWVSHGIVDRARTRVLRGAGVDSQKYDVPVARSEPPPLVVLFAARILRSKGVEAVLAAAQMLAEENAPIRFVIAGDVDPGDPDHFPMTGRAVPPTVHYAGLVRDIIPLLAEAHVVCLPTHYGEGIPRILIEGALAGCALVSSDLPACRQIVRNGKTGLAVKRTAGKVAAGDLADALRRLADDPALAIAMGRSARAFAIANGYEQKDVSLQLLGLLESGSRSVEGKTRR